MTFVTYIPRLIPFLLISDRELPIKLKKFLDYVPLTALGALIIPGAIQSIPERPEVSAIGIGFAILYSYFRGGIIVTVVGTIFIAYLLMVFL